MNTKCKDGRHELEKSSSVTISLQKKTCPKSFRVVGTCHSYITSMLLTRSMYCYVRVLKNNRKLNEWSKGYLWKCIRSIFTVFVIIMP